MSSVVIRPFEYRWRLSAVQAAEWEAEMAGRYGEAGALRLAVQVLESLIADEAAAPTRHRPSRH